MSWMSGWMGVWCVFVPIHESVDGWRWMDGLTDRCMDNIYYGIIILICLWTQSRRHCGVGFLMTSMHFVLEKYSFPSFLLSS